MFLMIYIGLKYHQVRDIVRCDFYVTCITDLYTKFYYDYNIFIFNYIFVACNKITYM